MLAGRSSPKRDLDLRFGRHGDGDRVHRGQHRVQAFESMDAVSIRDRPGFFDRAAPNPDQLDIRRGQEAGNVHFARPEGRADDAEAQNL